MPQCNGRGRVLTPFTPPATTGGRQSRGGRRRAPPARPGGGERDGPAGLLRSPRGRGAAPTNTATTVCGYSTTPAIATFWSLTNVGRGDDAGGRCARTPGIPARSALTECDRSVADRNGPLGPTSRASSVGLGPGRSENSIFRGSQKCLIGTVKCGNLHRNYIVRLRALSVSN
jgi:hypothetical protein